MIRKDMDSISANENDLHATADDEEDQDLESDSLELTEAHLEYQHWVATSVQRLYRGMRVRKEFSENKVVYYNAKVFF